MRKKTMALVAMMLGLTWSGQVVGKVRDADGSRMQAREQRLGSTISDRITPPNDSVDWRYVRIAKAQSLGVRVTTRGEKQARVQVTNAVGKSIMDGSTQKGRLSLSRPVDPGLYYVAVSSNVSVEYSITLR